MINFKRVFVGVALAGLSCIAAAQRITESVTVEGKYTPEFIPADRLALLPATLTLKAPESPMTYDRKGVAANFVPDALNMPATGWRANKNYDMSKGYVDFRMGSWLNSSLSAGYNAINNPNTRLNIYLQHNSTSLWQAWKENAQTGLQGADKRYRYDETLGADLVHTLQGIGKFNIGLQYHVGCFNYYGTRQGGKADESVKAPSQTLNDVYARVGWNGYGSERLNYTAEADVRHFAYRAMYVPLLTAEYPRRYASSKGERETAVNVGGNVKYALSDEVGNGSAIGIGLLYSGVLNSIGNDVNRLEATPAYILTGRTYALRIGANLAVVGNGESTKLRVAPDVNFSARKGVAAFSASIGGGTHLRTLAWKHTMDYYSNPGDGCYQAAYTPLDVKLSFQLNPGGKWTIGIAGEWRTTRDESFGGLYQALLNDNLNEYGTYPENGKIHGVSISVNAGYEFSRYLALDGRCAVQPQNGNTGFLNGFDRPKLTADFSAISRPIDKLSLYLDYRLRAKRLLLPGHLSRLDLRGEYRITDRISVGAELNNLLNRHDEFLPGLPLEGFNVAAGMQFVF